MLLSRSDGATQLLELGIDSYRQSLPNDLLADIVIARLSELLCNNKTMARGFLYSHIAPKWYKACMEFTWQRVKNRLGAANAANVRHLIQHSIAEGDDLNMDERGFTGLASNKERCISRSTFLTRTNKHAAHSWSAFAIVDS